MIKPVTIGLRILAILATLILELIRQPLKALAEIFTLLAGEILEPLTEEIETFKLKLEHGWPE